MAHTKTTPCPHCGREIRNNNFTKHVTKCSTPKLVKIRGIDYDPNRGYADGTRKSWNKGQTKETNSSLMAASMSMKKRISEGYTPSGCATEEWNRSEYGRMCHSRGGGYKENAGKSKKFGVYDSFGNKTTLQSTYELAVFEILCELGIVWSRPKALKYDGKNYFADFFLHDYNIWLDPKNDYKAVIDAEKIERVMAQNGVRVYVLLKHQITKDYIGRLAEMD